MRNRTTVSMLFVWLGAFATSAQSRQAPSEDAPAPPGIHFEEPFDDDALPKRGWYDGARYRIVKPSHAGAGCIEYEWLSGGSGVSGSGTVRHLFPPSDEIHLRFYLRLSERFGWSGKGFHPHLIQVLTTENPPYAGPAATHLTLYVEPCDGKLRLAAQDIQNKDAPSGLTQGPLKGGYNGTLYESARILFTDDRWHCIEAQFKLNTLDPATGLPRRDGIVRGWFDGELVVDRADVLLRSGDFPQMKLNQLILAPYFGPGLVPKAQKLWIDELSVGPRRMKAP